ncbi:effector 5 protein [Rutstroemia sp. NJR-2017a WRK4]|nr:effector 5 protein [Rutstroemia sp. NJR-2017a WRK4]PQE11827.1 effector 5 protein [Rutstroemia sp. NJR-2017a WRK4]
MMFSMSAVLAGISMLSLALAAPTNLITTTTLEKRGTFSCASPVSGLTASDCNHMSNIKMFAMGTNAKAANGGVWIGSQGPNIFAFTNKAAVPITLIIWTQIPNDFQSSFMIARTPAISYSLSAGQTVTISMANTVSGGWSALYNGQTTLTPNGQINNTWGEFTTGASATVDISSLINMSGNHMSITVGGSGCVSNMSKCIFQCKPGQGNICGLSGTYNLNGCANGSQPGANYGMYLGNPAGGCQGFSNGGHVTVDFL